MIMLVRVMVLSRVIKLNGVWNSSRNKVVLMMFSGVVISIIVVCEKLCSCSISNVVIMIRNSGMLVLIEFCLCVEFFMVLLVFSR